MNTSFQKRFARVRQAPALRAAAFTALVVSSLNCDTSSSARDASTPLAQRVSEISIRVDVPSGGAPSVSVLAFRAMVIDFPVDGVLGVVDPLVSPAPEARCEMRDMASAARTLRAGTAEVALEDFGNIAVELGENAPVLRPAPRVYPDFASVVSGVVGEVVPTDVAGIPETITIGTLGSTTAIPTRIPLAVPGVPRMAAGDGTALGTAARFESNGDLALLVGSPAGAFVELRPFGSTLAVACPVGPSGRVTVPADLIDRLGQVSGKVPVSVDAVSRENHMTRIGGQTTRLSLEIRASTILDLRQ